ncbi:MAG: helix-turn-helix transcriptional regulator [Chloroflexi bacterium]|nr:helix-turn-helix transcriptional regulator [Chloroflexota bacterium]
MIINFEERPSDSPVVDMIWRGQTESAGYRIAPAGGCWAMLVERQGVRARLSIVGPMKKAMPMYYDGDVEFLVIKFKPGTFMPHLPVRNFLDSVVSLPEAASKSFWLNGSARQFPDYENAETFVDRLVRDGLLVREPVIDAVLQGQPQAISSRSVQRRFLHATGLPHSSIRQITRARQAMTLLQRGVPILDTVHEAGYTDQPHMTKSLKHFIGQTPAQIVRQSQAG